jgi:hypothetical protein
MPRDGLASPSPFPSPVRLNRELAACRGRLCLRIAGKPQRSAQLSEKSERWSCVRASRFLARLLRWVRKRMALERKGKFLVYLYTPSA